MTNPVIFAAAYLLITGQVPGQPPVHGLGGDAVPSHLLGLGRDCQLPQPPRHEPVMRPVQPPRGNHLTIRWRDHQRRHHRHHRGR